MLSSWSCSTKRASRYHLPRGPFAEQYNQPQMQLIYARDSQKFHVLGISGYEIKSSAYICLRHRALFSLATHFGIVRFGTNEKTKF